MISKELLTEAKGDPVFAEDLLRISDTPLPYEELKDKKILVTGATGLVGQAVVRALLTVSREHGIPLTVYALCRDEEKTKRLYQELLARPALIPVYGDVRDGDLPGDTDIIIHAASPTASKFFVTKPVETMEIAIGGTKNMLELAKKAGAKIELGRALSAKEIADMEPWGVVVATGGEPLRPRSIEGVDHENVYTPPQIIHREKVLRGKTVVVAGSGLTGLETAEILCQTGNRVTVIEMAPELAPGAWFQLIDDEMERLSKTDTKFETGTKLLAVDDRGVTVQDVKSGETRLIPADALVLSLGVRPAGNLARQLDMLSVRRIWRVGDAVRSGTIADACHSAFDTVMAIK